MIAWTGTIAISERTGAIVVTKWTATMTIFIAGSVTGRIEIVATAIG